MTDFESVKAAVLVRYPLRVEPPDFGSLKAALDRAAVEAGALQAGDGASRAEATGASMVRAHVLRAIESLALVEVSALRGEYGPCPRCDNDS